MFLPEGRSEEIEVQLNNVTIDIIYPYNTQTLPPGTKDVVVKIITNIEAECQYSLNDFIYGQGVDLLTDDTKKIHTFEIHNMTTGKNYKFYYKSKEIQTGNSFSKAVKHTFQIYNESTSLRIISNSIQARSSRPSNELRYLFDNNPNSYFSTDNTILLNETNTLTLNFLLPNKGTFNKSKREISHFRFRSSDLIASPDLYDIYADGKCIFSNCMITPLEKNIWVDVDVPNTYLTNLTIVIKSVQGNDKRKVIISDIEIFSTELEKYIVQEPKNGYLGIPRWWNNLQWAYSLHVDDVHNVPDTVSKFGSVMPLTLQLWREYINTFGNVTQILNSGHEFGSHGYSHSNSKDFSYLTAYKWLNDSKVYVEKNVQKTSRWSDNTVLSFAYPYSSSNYHVTDAAYDVGFRISGQVNSETAIASSWNGWSGGNNFPRDEKDWMQIGRLLGEAKADSIQFKDGTFELRWKWTKENGYFGDSMLHPDETMAEAYKNAVFKDKDGWQCTWGEVRAYYYYSEHTFLTYNPAESSDDVKVFTVNIIEDNRISHWKVPITYIFDIDYFGFKLDDLKMFLEKDLKLRNIKGSQRMCEGYYFDENLLYLSLVKSNGDKISLMQKLLPNIIDTFPENNDEDIDPNENILLFFNKPINTSSLSFICVPDPGSWYLSWSNDNTILSLSHDPFKSSNEYIFKINYCKDLLGNPLVTGRVPNPWSFTTRDAEPPYIIETNPKNGSRNVQSNDFITIKFNEQMNPDTLKFTCIPDPGGWNISWYDEFQLVVLTHFEFKLMQEYKFTMLECTDVAHNNLVFKSNENIIEFYIEDSKGPKIDLTSPENNDNNVPISKDIIIHFNERINKSSLIYSCTPDPGGWNVKWSDNDTTAWFEHNYFKKSTKYIFTLEYCDDLSGNPLIFIEGLNQLSLRTIENIEPVIVSTPPYDANANELYLYQLEVEDKDDNQFVFKLISAPKGMTLDINTGLIEWTPSIHQLGNNMVELGASDGMDTDVQKFYINVKVDIPDNEPATSEKEKNIEENDNNDQLQENNNYFLLCGGIPFIIFLLLSMVVIKKYNIKK